MPYGHFKYLVDQSADMGAKTVSLFGYGEPLLDPDLDAKIFYCSTKGLETFITSNGSLLDPGRAKQLMRSGLSHIRFSVHGLFSKDYEKVHRGLSYLLVLRNIFNFIILNRKRNDNKCKISMSVIPMNGENIQNIRDLWEPHVDWLEIWKPHNWADGKYYRPLARKKESCGRPFNGPIQINADGKMMVCCFDYDAKLTVGDTYQNSIEEILKGEAFSHIRSKHETGCLDGLICEQCDQLNEEEENPLLYSNRDPERKINITSSTKFKLETKDGSNNN
jgi:MoaA/NifB/PqqE/SkfB family radical SAM enzyme